MEDCFVGVKRSDSRQEDGGGQNLILILLLSETCRGPSTHKQNSVSVILGIVTITWYHSETRPEIFATAINN